MAASNLPGEFQRYNRHIRQLKQIVRETKRAFQDINTFGNLDQGQSLTAELGTVEETAIGEVIHKHPGLIILGQSCYAKAFLTNEIFSQTILPPVSSSEDNTKRWRMVRFKYGDKASVSLTLPDSFELVDNLAAYNRPWRTIPMEDLVLRDDEIFDPARSSAVLEVQLNHPLLKEGAYITLSPTNHLGTVEQVYKKFTEDVLPIMLYAVAKDSLSEKDLKELRDLKNIIENTPIFFIRVPLPVQEELSQISPLHNNMINEDDAKTQKNSNKLFQQLCDLGYLSLVPPNSIGDTSQQMATNELIEDFEQFYCINEYVQRSLRGYLLHIANLLHIVHSQCLSSFIMTAFDMARDMLITPRRLEFARNKENELYASLMDIAIKKQDEIRSLIGETIAYMRPELLKKAADYNFIGLQVPDDGKITSIKDLKVCTGQIQELVLSNLNSAIAAKLVESVNILRESYTGTLTRCLESLEHSEKEASQECSATTEAFKQTMNAAYQVEITLRTSSSLVRVLLEKMKQMLQSMPWQTPPKITLEWKQKVAEEMINSLSENRLARSICSQIKERLKNSHDAFASALRQLEARHSGRLERTEEQRLRVRKVHAPRVARLALESVSLRDLIMYGMPQMGREVGRGQYGVVYSCEKWAGFSPCAIKSVVPPDDKHWNDLALEFYYTKNVPDHDRIVALRGSVIDYSYGGGTSPAVLLVMDRLQRDLYSAIKTGMDWASRLVVAIDVVVGIRFLHSQGLVHRDIKLKNVLLDKQNRGKITDLGFCKPEAMMSGSIVGTPIHMAPELFSGKYDNSVDVYAFGILFWYISAGHVRLPYSFEQCTSKDMLWTSVKKGVRPEKLPIFTDECWQLMQACWEGEPSKRPLLGIVEPQLHSILQRYQNKMDGQSDSFGASSSSSPTPMES